MTAAEGTGPAVGAGPLRSREVRAQMPAPRRLQAALLAAASVESRVEGLRPGESAISVVRGVVKYFTLSAKANIRHKTKVAPRLREPVASVEGAPGGPTMMLCEAGAAIDTQKTAFSLLPSESSSRPCLDVFVFNRISMALLGTGLVVA
jgi:hypothetical protein